MQGNRVLAIRGPSLEIVEAYPISEQFVNPLCFFCFRGKCFVALKIVKSASHYTETAVDEMKLLQTVSLVVVYYFFIREKIRHVLLAIMNCLKGTRNF